MMTSKQRLNFYLMGNPPVDAFIILFRLGISYSFICLVYVICLLSSSCNLLVLYLAILICIAFRDGDSPEIEKS